MLKTTVKIKKTLDKTNNIISSLEKLKHKAVLVGVPQDEDQRDSEETGNAELLFWQEKGDPLIENAPPRPVLDPTIQKNKKQIGILFGEVIQEALRGNFDGVDIKLKRLALFAENEVKNYFGSDELPELAPSTIEARARKKYKINKYQKAATRQKYREKLADYIENGIFAPLVDTGELRNSIKGVVRNT